MEKISKSEMDYIISKNIIRQSKGNYGDFLVITNKQGNKNKKQRYVTPFIYNKFISLKEKEVFDINQVRKDQRYMFENSVS